MRHRFMHTALQLATLSSLLTQGACADQRMPLERFLTDLKPGAVVALPDFGWPTGALLCPMGYYHNRLASQSATAQRVNLVLQRSVALGDEGSWTLVVVRPDTTGTDGIGQLVFEGSAVGVVSEASQLQRAVSRLPEGYTWQECVPAERARVLALGIVQGHRLVAFGVEGGN